ncbi:MAG: hydrogenase maturation nickel metallochaperone HypA [Candidatus Kuenenia sp.]|nr:hydrogenase maturation nickel metallochaperone HypA [Candidatus Kuenenia hertensis]
MHEFHVVENIIENVNAATKENGHKKAVAINVSISS